jgi:Family of unknown function (DUF6345)
LPVDLPSALPSFRLRKPVDADDAIGVLAEDVFKFAEFTRFSEGNISIACETGSAREVEFDRTTGSIWMADWDRLWNPYLRPSLPAVDEAAALAKRFMREHQLLPAATLFTGYDVSVGEPVVSGTIRTNSQGGGVATLDVHVGFPVTIRVNGGRHEIVGHGGKWSVTFGHERAIINCLAGKFEADGAPLVDQPLPLPARLPDGATTSIVFERWDDEEGRQWLLPMYFVKGEGETNPSWLRYAATATARDILERRITEERLAVRAVSVSQQTLADARKSLGPGALLGATWTMDAQEPNSLRKLHTIGFVRKMRAHHWTMQSYFEEKALEEHWDRKRDDFLEQIDVAYYCGHASPDGWMLTAPEDNELDTGDVNRLCSPVRFGQLFVNWVFIDACGPLQDCEITKTHTRSAIATWRPIFEGLLGFCGFATDSVPGQDNGAVLGRALANRPVVQAWFRAGRECQPFAPGAKKERDGIGVWMAALMVDDEGIRASSLRIDDCRGERRRAAPRNILAMWAPA